MDTVQTDQLLTFFKALADESRLKIVGLLTQQPHSVDELAAMLGLSAPTVSHHLNKLQKAGLVQAQAQQYYNIYSLRMDALHGMAKQILKAENLSKAVDEIPGMDQDAFTRKVLSTWVKDGRLVGLPSQLKKFTAVVEWVGQKFESGRWYSEMQVDDVLMQVYPRDPDSLRRALIDHKLLARKKDGSAYWRTNSPQAATRDFDPESLPQSSHQLSSEWAAARQVWEGYRREGKFRVLDQPDRLAVVWNYLRFRFDPDKQYTEEQVDAILKRYCQGEPEQVRRLLAKHKLLTRKNEHWSAPAAYRKQRSSQVA